MWIVSFIYIISRSVLCVAMICLNFLFTPSNCFLNDFRTLYQLTPKDAEKNNFPSINVLPTWTPNYGLDLSKFFTNWQRDIITQCFTTDNSLWLKFVHEINFPFSKGFLCSDKVSKKQPTSKKWNEVLIMKEEHT